VPASTSTTPIEVIQCKVRSVSRRTIELRIGGQTYRVVSSASEEELLRLAAKVDAKVAELAPVGKPPPQQAVVLAAIALAHDVETERSRRVALERKSRDMMRRVLVRVESALDMDEAGGESFPAEARPQARPPLT
jgi:cell division protein ZapA